MISRLAKSEIMTMQREGLKPTVDDIILLNALGLKVEKGKEAAEFSALPRQAFLGDYILTEPSLNKRLFIEKCTHLLDEGYYTNLFFLLWALNIEDDKLPSLDNIQNVLKPVAQFKEKMMVFTERQLVTAIDYVMSGDDPTTNEDFIDLSEKEQKEISQVVDIPEQIKSSAQELYCDMMIYNLPEKCACFTMPTVERMVYNAIILKGVDISKNEQAQNCAKFYVAVGKIRTRLLDEKSKQDNLK